MGFEFACKGTFSTFKNHYHHHHQQQQQKKKEILTDKSNIGEEIQICISCKGNTAQLYVYTTVPKFVVNKVVF